MLALKLDNCDDCYCILSSCLPYQYSTSLTSLNPYFIIQFYFTQFTGEISAPKLLAKWSPTYRDELLSKYGTNKEELVAYFGKIRDDLIAEDVKAWVGLNQVNVVSFIVEL